MDIIHKRKYTNFVVFGFLLIFSLISTGCVDKNDYLPKTLQLTDLIYSQDKSNLMGPGGLNQSFYVFKMKSDVVEEIRRDGLGFFKSITPVIKYSRKGPSKDLRVSNPPFWTNFTKWTPLPVVKNDKWIRRSRALDSTSQPTFSDFFTGTSKRREFENSIDPEILATFQKVINSKSGYYAYGYYRETCALIVSPEFGLAYFLFRD
jgi:hypothetical protein